jgi:hypothetical protein
VWCEAFVKSDEEDFATSSSAFHEAFVVLLQQVTTAMQTPAEVYTHSAERLNSRHCYYRKEMCTLGCSFMRGTKS